MNCDVVVVVGDVVEDGEVAAELDHGEEASQACHDLHVKLSRNARTVGLKFN